MTHEFESGFFARQPAWHRLGVVLPEAPRLEDAITLAGLDWQVTTAPLYTVDADEVETHRVVIRESDKKILGVVGTGYRPLQNAKAFSFFEPFLDSGACSLEAAGSLREGKRIWVLARLEAAEAEVVGGDTVRGYFLLSNAHDGSQAVRAQFTSVRVVCMNTLTLADRRAKKGFEDSLRVRHTANVEEGLRSVQGTIDMAHRTFSATLSDFQRMAARPIGVEGLSKYVTETLDVPEPLHRSGKMPRAWEAILSAYYHGPGAEKKGVFGTYWGAYNAVTHWVDHTRGTSGEDQRLDSAWFGSGSRIKRRAFELAVA